MWILYLILGLLVFGLMWWLTNTVDQA
jgi:hypothetical protein